MPCENGFRHQVYSAERPSAPFHALCAVPPGQATVDAARERELLSSIGRRWRARGVAAVYLLHGTFAGADGLGLVGELGRFLPTVAQRVREAMKSLVDHALDDAGNYTEAFALRLADGLHGDLGVGDLPSLPVRRLNWSSENLHIGRADGAIRLLDELAGRDWPQDARVMVWAHSHAGNALALASNLLAASDGGAAFFRACHAYYRRPGGVRAGFEHWPRVERQLRTQESSLRRITLEVVTFGTPIRYGWDPAGYGRLLHVVHHRPCENLPVWRATLPRSREQAAELGGDLVQQIGIAGTNFTPPLTARHLWRAERRLRRIVEGDLRRRELLARLECGQRVAAEGTTLLVDYGADSGALAGHAVYTRERWLAFHAYLVDLWLYGGPGLKGE